MDDLDAARPAADLVGADARQSLGEHLAVGRLQLDSVTGRERAVAADDADREQAASVHEQRAPRSLVDDETTDGRLRVAEPELEGGAAVDGLRSKARASSFPGDDRTENAAASPGCDHGGNAGGGGEPCGRDLARHPAST